jgi:gliding motility-associated-like protein
VFTWTNGENTNFADSMAAGSHSVTIADAFGCEITIDFDINQPDSLHVELTSDDIVPGYQVSPFGNDNGSIMSYVTGGTPEYEYSWAMGSTDPDLYNLTAGTYYLTVTDANRCKASAQIILVEPGTLEIPEGVSPNGDLLNDYFVVRGLEAYPENDITIYNRWGNVVYEQSGYQNDWEGQNNRGEALPDGTYYVILNVYDGNERITLTGYIDLRRTR